MQTSGGSRDIATIVSAYASTEMPDSFWHDVETIILENAPRFTADEAITLLNAVNFTVSSETIEVFDRIIGKDIDDLSPSQIY